MSSIEDLGSSSSSGQEMVDGVELSAAALDALQSSEQRQVLDTVSQLRKCGLDSVLSLPQLVVCGDQSAGKSSVLEALTEIPFPRKDNLCTRFPTEIIIRRGKVESLVVRIIPDPQRPVEEREALNCFDATINDLRDLPDIMARATGLMGLELGKNFNLPPRAFSKDVLVVEIEGPTRPQLTVVDLPGIIQAETKDASQTDVDMTVEITKSYISLPRTICLAVISGANDYANQPILNLVRRYDPKGERTLGIITKPDLLPSGSESEQSFLKLARNEDIVFGLGWHVLKNRSFEEGSFSTTDRNNSEADFFRNSTFCQLRADQLGVQSLVIRLSNLLFAHIRQELPKLQQDLEAALAQTRRELTAIGSERGNAGECKNYLIQLSLRFHEICQAAVNGYYEGGYFQSEKDKFLQANSSDSTRRLRAVVQLKNKIFSDEIRSNGQKFRVGEEDGKSGDEQIHSVQVSLDLDIEESSDEQKQQEQELEEHTPSEIGTFGHIESPLKLTQQNAMRWVNDAVTRARGRELPGNFNPLVIAELFWEQSSKWHLFAVAHIDQISEICRCFLELLLREQCPNDIQLRLWPKIQEEVRARRKRAIDELERILEETKSYPINYNHYYTDTIRKRQAERRELELKRCLEDATRHVEMPECSSDHTFPSIDVDLAMKYYSERMDPDMDKHSSELVLDCLWAIYKVCEKVFVTNVTVQVIERHIVRGLEHIFSPVTVSRLKNSEILSLVAEPLSTKEERKSLTDKERMLDDGREIFTGLTSRILL